MLFIVLGAGVVAMLVYGAVVDHRARRRGRSSRDGAAMSHEVRDARRDARAWDAGSVGHSGEDLSWMRHRGR